MTDETPDERVYPPAGGGDPDEALRRLESMGSAKRAGPGPPEPLPPEPVIDSFSGPPPRVQRPMGGAQRASRPRRPAGSPRSGRWIARIAAPVVFLVAVIALLSIVVQSGVVGGSDQPVVTPTVKATKTKGGTTTVVTKKYVIKSGDSLSSIADHYKTSTSALLELNPDLDGSSTLVVGQKIRVPVQ